MADTENVKQKTAEVAAVTEKEVLTRVDAVEHSKLGHQLTDSIHNATICDFMKILLLVILIDFIPFFLLFTGEGESKLGKLMFAFRKWGYLVTFIAYYIVAVTVYITGARGIEIYHIFALAIKNAVGFATMLIVILTEKRNLTNLILAIIYVGYTAIVDVLYLYYSVIYIKRMNSDEYDEYGVKIQRKEEKV